MTKVFLLAVVMFALVGGLVFAVPNSNKSRRPSGRDQSTGLASGKRQHGKTSGKGKSTGKTFPDDWQSSGKGKGKPKSNPHPDDWQSRQPTG